MRRYASAWAIWPTVAATWLAYAQVISFQALALFVVGGSVIAALSVTALCRAGRRLFAVVALVVLTFGFAWLAEVLAGNTSGPVTRATLMACGITGAMALMLHTRYPLAILPASLLLIAGALGLGAADRVPWLAGLWAVAVAVTIGMFGPYRQGDLRDRRRLGPFALMLLVPGLVAVLSMAIVSPLMTDPWTIPGSGQVAVLPTPSPSAVSPTPSPSPSASSSASSVAPSSSPSASTVPPTAAPLPPAEEVDAVSPSSLISWLQLALLLLLLILTLLVLALIAWRAWVALLWWRLRRRLDSGSPRQRAIGAWTWLRMQHLRRDAPLPVSVSPDVALTWARGAGEADVLTVAQVVAPVAFDDALPVAEGDAARAWAAALSSGRLPLGSLRQRWRWALRTPRWVIARMPNSSPTRQMVAPR
jgi:hypothetical protein